MSLTEHLRRRIAADGPVSVAEYMATALGHPRFGYYATRDPLGVAGDFVTAPEISQMFGELIGLWLADAWRQMGGPDPVLLVELGPGRGTLMADALRAMRVVPGLREAVRPHLVETSPLLRAAQAERLRGAGAAWHDRLGDVPPGPMLLVANEFFDALPIRQFQRTPAGWRERLIGWDDQRDEQGDDRSGRFRFVLAARLDPLAALIPAALSGEPVGSVVELSPPSWSIATEIGRRLARHDGAALVIDYGYLQWAAGDTLQAVRDHRFADPLIAPGEADLTAHVNFSALAAAVAEAGARIVGIVPQGAFLCALGIGERADALTRGATPDQANAIGAALRRLTTADQMGDLFKVLGLTGQDPRHLSGFEA